MLKMGLVRLQDPASRLHVREASTVLSMIRVIRKVSFGLRMHGLKYLYRAPVNEFNYPRLAATRALRRFVVSVTDKLSPGPAAGPRWPDEALLFVYDLAIGPVTFDFISYLAAAVAERGLRTSMSCSSRGVKATCARSCPNMRRG
jgi:hypothetical protein